jgi:uncharacterized protein YegL
LTTVGVALAVSQGCSSQAPPQVIIIREPALPQDAAVPPPKDAAVGEDASMPLPDVFVPPVEACTGGEGQAAKSSTVFYFVVDGSGSMNCTGGEPACKRTAQEQALRAIFNQYKAAADPTLGVGMLYFGPDGTYPMADDVPIAFVDDAQLAKLLARVNAFPDGLTPTFEAMTGAFGVLDGYVGKPPLTATASKVIVLMTDGEPNDKQTELLNLVAQYSGRPKDPIPTYAVGIGVPGAPGYNAAYMTQLATAGKTARPGCNPSATTANFCHFQLTPGASTASLAQNLQTALATIKDQRSSSCEFALKLEDANGNPANPDTMQVHLVGPGSDEKLTRGDANGWDFVAGTGKTAVQLFGDACGEVKSDATKTVLLKFGCNVQ